jgi:microtubule-associated protein, RP/EB family
MDTALLESVLPRPRLRCDITPQGTRRAAIDRRTHHEPPHRPVLDAPPPPAASRTRTPLASGGGAAGVALREENNAPKETVASLEREQDFYFSKLRDTELLSQQIMEADPTLEKENGLLKQIHQKIL